MTKFNERLENDLGQIADQATPSPTAWAAIQNRIAEPEPNEARDIIMLTDEREQVSAGRTPKWLPIAAAAAVAIIVAGVFALSRGDGEDLLVTDDPPAEVTVDGDVEEDSAPDTSEPPVEEAKPLIVGLPVTGLMEADQLGITMTFETDEMLATDFVEPGSFALFPFSEVGRFGASRVGGWYDAEQSIDDTHLGEGSIDANDVEAWIENNQHIAQRLPDTAISGRTARVYDITLDENMEGSIPVVRSRMPSWFDDSDRCVLVNSVSTEFPDPQTTTYTEQKAICSDQRRRLWFIEVDGFDPIAIWAEAFDDSGYIDEFEATILPTIEIGPDAGP